MRTPSGPGYAAGSTAKPERWVPWSRWQRPTRRPRSARSTLTSARVGLKVRLGDPDRLLDRIVEQAIREADDQTGST